MHVCTYVRMYVRMYVCTYVCMGGHMHTNSIYITPASAVICVLFVCEKIHIC